MPDRKDARKDGAVWEVLGRGVGGLEQPAGDLDFGNSGTGVRLMLGVLAGHGLTARLVGDASLSRRPMGRVLRPLERMGLEVLDKGPMGQGHPAPHHTRLRRPDARSSTSCRLPRHRSSRPS